MIHRLELFPPSSSTKVPTVGGKDLAEELLATSVCFPGRSATGVAQPRAEELRETSWGLQLLTGSGAQC